MRHKGLKLLWIVSAVIVLACIIRAMRPLKTFSCDLDGQRFSTDSQKDILLESNISLTPGIWSVTLKCAPSSDMTSVVIIRDDNVIEPLLLTNGGNIHVGLDGETFDVLVFTNTDTAELVLKCDDPDITVYSAKFEETRLLWARIIVIVLFLNACIYAVVRFTGEGGKFSTKKGRKVFLLVTLIGFLGAMPYLSQSMITAGDLLYHIQRIEGVRSSILSGFFPCRLEPHWQQGYGYANGLFYCPLYLYIPGVMRCIGFTVTEAYTFYCIFFSFLTAWIAYYSYSRIFKRKDVGIVSCALYTLSIIHFNKWAASANVGECSAMAFLPLILLSIYELFFADKEEGEKLTARSWVPLMVGMTGIIQCHVLSCEMTAFVLLVTGIVFVKRMFKRGAILPIVKAALGTLALCLWYLVPFVDYYLSHDIGIKYASARTIQGVGAYPATHLVHFWIYGENGFISATGMKESYHRGIGFIFVAALAIFFVAKFASRKTADKKDGIAAFSTYSFAAGIALIIMSLAIFPWDWIQFSSSISEPLVSSLQFPIRWFDYATAFCAVVAGYVMIMLEKRWNKVGYYASVLAVVISVVTSSAFVLEQIETVPGRLSLYNGEGFGLGYISGGEYVIKGADPYTYLFNNYVAGDDVAILDYESGPLSAKVHVENHSAGDSWVEVPLAYYKGYRAYSDDGEMELVMGDNAVVRVVVPEEFSGNVLVKFVSPWYWRASEIISLIAYISVIAWALKNKRLVKRRENETEQE